MTEPSFRLLLIRHAKAADGAVDAERELTTRGHRDAVALGRWLVEHDLVPQLAVVSPARRAEQTWQSAASVFESTSLEVTDGRIYDNDPAGLLEVVRQSGAHVRSLALVGHNPSIEELARLLDDGAGSRTLLAAGVPTCTVAVFAFTVPATEAQPGTGTLVGFTTARA